MELLASNRRGVQSSCTSQESRRSKGSSSSLQHNGLGHIYCLERGPSADFSIQHNRHRQAPTTILPNIMRVAAVVGCLLLAAVPGAQGYRVMPAPASMMAGPGQLQQGHQRQRQTRQVASSGRNRR